MDQYYQRAVEKEFDGISKANLPQRPLGIPAE
jgi:hypothetical protein